MTVNVFSGCVDDRVSVSGEHNDTLEAATSLPLLGDVMQICDYDADFYSFSLAQEDFVRVAPFA